LLVCSGSRATLLFANSLTRFAISTLDCRNNLISDAVNIRGVEQITRFSLCKAAKSEAKLLIPQIFKRLSMFQSQSFKCKCHVCRVGFSCQNGCTQHCATAYNMRPQVRQRFTLTNEIIS